MSLLPTNEGKFRTDEEATSKRKETLSSLIPYCAGFPYLVLFRLSFYFEGGPLFWPDDFVRAGACGGRMRSPLFFCEKLCISCFINSQSKLCLKNKLRNLASYNNPS